MNELQFAGLVRRYLSRYRIGAFTCAGLHLVTLWAPVVLSALAALYIQFDRSDRTVALMSGSAALLSTFSAFGEFKEKWHANRKAVYALRRLLLQFETRALSLGEARAMLETVFDRHEDEWGAAT